MTVVVQTNYSPQIRPAVEGMIADMMPSAIVTRLCETMTGIPFGKAVSQGTQSAKGVLLGGASKYQGVTVIDNTLSISPLDPYSSTLNPVDAYGYQTNVAVMTRGHLWGKAWSVIAPNDPVYYDAALGTLGNAAAGQSANGSIQFSQQPADGNTIIINGVTITFHASGATGDDINIGPTLGDTVAALATHLNGSATTGISALVYGAYPPSPGGSAQGSGSNTLTISEKTPGTAGNAIAISAAGTPGATASGATLSGGTAASILIPNAHWIDAAVSGQLAKVALFGG
jgi:hypothetical protein